MPKGTFKSPQEIGRLLELLMEGMEEVQGRISSQMNLTAIATLRWITGEDEREILDFLSHFSGQFEGVYDEAEPSNNKESPSG